MVGLLAILVFNLITLWHQQRTISHLKLLKQHLLRIQTISNAGEVNLGNEMNIDGFGDLGRTVP